MDRPYVIYNDKYFARIAYFLYVSFIIWDFSLVFLLVSEILFLIQNLYSLSVMLYDLLCD